MPSPIIHIDDLAFEHIISAQQIRGSVEGMAQQLTDKFHDKRPVFISILNGSARFVADLMSNIDFDCELTFARLASYKGTVQKEIEEGFWHDVPLQGRHVIVVDDIIDSGNTLSKFIPLVEKEEPESVSIVSLLIKPESLEQKLDILFTGFDIPERFVVGYGLDYNGLGRNLNDIYALAPEGQ